MISEPNGASGSGPETPSNNGGQGGKDCLKNFHDGAGQTSDTRLIERALREQWDVPAELREQCVARMGKVLSDSEASHREATSAVRAVGMMVKQNFDANVERMRQFMIGRGVAADAGNQLTQVNIYIPDNGRVPGTPSHKQTQQLDSDFPPLDPPNGNGHRNGHH